MKALLLALAVAAGPLVGACESPHKGITLWHSYNGAERDALTASADRWNTLHPDQPIELVAVPHSGFGDKITSAIPNGNGPDLFIYAQDRIGDWADSGVIEPIEFWLDDARLDRFDPKAVEAMAYNGSLWGLPVTTKSLALFYRTDIVAEPPASTDELFALGTKLPHGVYPIAYANGNLYGHAPWLFGSGGKILDRDDKLAIASTEAANAIALAKRMVDQRIAPRNAEEPKVAAMFNDGSTATAVSGPWFIAGIDPKVPWKVAPLPIVSATGKPAAPFYGAEALLMSSRSKDKDLAFAVIDFLTSDQAAIDRARTAHETVPNIAAFAVPEIGGDPVIDAFRRQLATAVPMAKVPAMRMVWTPYQTALDNAMSGRQEPAAALRALEREIEDYLKGMGR